jgi:hypothetical protein
MRLTSFPVSSSNIPHTTGASNSLSSERFHIRWIAAWTTLIAIGVVLIAVLLLFRRITHIGDFPLLWLGVMGTIGVDHLCWHDAL